MTRDFMDRPVELLLMDGFLLANIEHIVRLQNEKFLTPRILALGAYNIDKIVATNKKLADAEKCAAKNVVSQAQGAGYIDIRDWNVIIHMIDDMGKKEEFRKWK